MSEISRGRSRLEAEKLQKPLVQAANEYANRLIDEYAALAGTEMAMAKMKIRDDAQHPNRRLKIVEAARRIFERHADKHLSELPIHLTADEQTAKHVGVIAENLGLINGNRFWNECFRNHDRIAELLANTLNQIEAEQDHNAILESRKERLKRDREAKKRGQNRGL